MYVTRSDDNDLKMHSHDSAVLGALAKAKVVKDENRILLQELS